MRILTKDGRELRVHVVIDDLLISRSIIQDINVRQSINNAIDIIEEMEIALMFLNKEDNHE